MVGGLEQAKRPVSAALAGPYGHPWHPILVTVPIGAWVASLVFDIGSRLVSAGAFLVQGSLWLIAIGVLGALAADGDAGDAGHYDAPRGLLGVRSGRSRRFGLDPVSTKNPRLDWYVTAHI